MENIDKTNTNVETQKNLNVGEDVRDKATPRYNHRLSMAMDVAGIRDIAEVAKKTKYSRSFISKVLHGHIHPTLVQAEDIAKALNISFTKIFDLGDIRDFNFQTSDKLEDEE